MTNKLVSTNSQRFMLLVDLLVRNTVPIDLAHHVCGGLGQLGSLTSLPVGT